MEDIKDLEGELGSKFRGEITVVEDGIATAVLTDESGKQFVGRTEVGKLADLKEVEEGVQFWMRYSDEGGNPHYVFEYIPPREISVEESRRMREETERALKNYDVEDD